MGLGGGACRGAVWVVSQVVASAGDLSEEVVLLVAW